jgi:CheY-like chemotaxis protein/signal transduction histidine kinase
LRRLIAFRYAVAVLVAASVLSLHLIFDAPIRWPPAMAALAALVLVDVALHWYVTARGTVSESALLVNFILEIVALTSILYFVGGSTSPLVSLYLLPLTMAANLLTRRHTWALALLTAACYSLLVATGVPVEEHVHDGGMQSEAFSQHLIGMWVVFVVSAGLVAHYVSSLAQAVHERDRQLARAREEALRNERIVALGTLGAGAAHELGTPLSTMSVLAEDMALRHADNAELAADVDVLQGEISRCKTIINALARAAGTARGESGSAQAADVFLLPHGRSVATAAAGGACRRSVVRDARAVAGRRSRARAGDPQPAQQRGRRVPRRVRGQGPCGRRRGGHRHPRPRARPHRRGELACRRALLLHQDARRRHGHRPVPGQRDHRALRRQRVAVQPRRGRLLHARGAAARARAMSSMLIVDDDATFCRVLARAMEGRGYAVTVAHDVPQAIASAERDPPRYAVVDLKMPGPSGLTLVRRLRELDPHARIVVLTGYASIATAIEAIKIGRRTISRNRPTPRRSSRRSGARTARPRCASRLRLHLSRGWSGSTSRKCSPSARATSRTRRVRSACTAERCSASSRSARPRVERQNA